MKIVKYIVLAFFLISIQELEAQTSPKVAGFFGDWHDPSEVSDVQWDKLTDIYFAFLQTDNSGNVSTTTNGSATTILQPMVTQAHQNGVKVHVSLGGANNSGNIGTVINNTTSRNNLISSIISFLQTYDLDGFNMDWEFPSASDATNLGTFMTDLKSQMNTLEGTMNKDLELSSAVGPLLWNTDGINSTFTDVCDYVFVMAFDAGGNCCVCDDNHSSQEVAENSMLKWATSTGIPSAIATCGGTATGKNVDPSKIVLAIPFYSNSPHPFSDYKDFSNSDPATYFNDLDGIYGGYGFNSKPMIQEKVDLIMNTYNGAGVWCWELPADRNDDYSLLSVMWEEMQPYLCNVAQPDLGNDVSICGQSSITLNSNVPTDGSITFQWYVNEVSQGTASTTANTFNATSAGTYKVVVSNGTCSNEDVVEVLGVLPTIDLEGPYDLCSPASQLLDAGVENVTYEWKWNNETLDGETSQTYLATKEGTYELTISASGCGNESDDVVITSSLANATGDTTCASGGSVSLTVAGDGPFSWYSVPVDGDELGSGNNFMTTINSNTTFYIENIAAADYSVGPTATNLVAEWDAAANTYVNFDALTDFALKSVEVMANPWQGGCVAVGTKREITIELYQNGSATGDSYDVEVTCGELTTAPVNFTIGQGDNYELRIVDAGKGHWQVNTQSGPHTQTDVVEITGNSSKSGAFFNWEIEVGTACDRTPVEAVIDPTHQSCFGNAPTADFIVDNNSSCIGADIQFTDASTDAPTSWSWDFGDGAIPSTATGQGPHAVSYTSSGNKNITLTVSNASGTDSETKLTFVSVQSAPISTSSINGDANVCLGSTETYSIPEVNGASGYNWTLPVGWSIVSGENTHEVILSVGSGSGSVTVQPINACGDGSLISKTVAVQDVPITSSSITGEVSVCENVTGESYSIASVAEANGYTWSMPSGTTYSGTGNAILVDFGTTSGQLSVTPYNSCGDGNEVSIDVTVNSAANNAGIITGLNSVCDNEVGVTYSINDVDHAESYDWTVPSGATVMSGVGTSTIIVDFGNSSGNIGVTPINTCGNGMSSSLPVTITNGANDAGVITGESTICVGEEKTYSIDAVMGASSYQWSLPTGWTITSGLNTREITVTVGTNNGTISVKPVSSCGDGAMSSIGVTTNTTPTSSSALTGSTSLCENTSGNSYSIPIVNNATSYVWSAPSDAVINGSSHTVTIDFGTTSGVVSVTPSNECGAGSAITTSIQLNAAASNAGVISGASSVCEDEQGITYSITSVSNAESYEWTVPSGASITGGQGTTSIQVNFGGLDGNIMVTPIQTCGNGNSSSIPVTITNGASNAGIITGNGQVCNGVTEAYSISSVLGASGYDWILPNGWSIVSGNNTNSILVDVGSSSGEIQVVPTSSCGNGTSSTLTVTSSDVPVSNTAFIQGDNQVCEGDVNKQYTVQGVTGATNYTWSVPTGATIVDNNNTATVSFGSTSGQLEVEPKNTCGAGTKVIVDIIVNINTEDALPIVGESSACIGKHEVYSIPVVSGATSYAWTYPGDWEVVEDENTNSIELKVGEEQGNVTVTPIGVCQNGNSAVLAVQSVSCGLVVDFSVTNQMVCQDEVISFTSTTINASANASYSWSFGEGAVVAESKSQGPHDVYYTSPGLKTVSLTVIDGETVTEEKVNYIEVKSLPQTSNITGVETVNCEGEAVYSVTNNENSLYNWNFPSGAEVTQGLGSAIVTIKFGTASGEVSVAESNNGCVGELKSINVDVDCQPTSIEEQIELETKVTPNPYVNHFFIQIDEVYSNFNYEIFDLKGALVKRGNVEDYQVEVDGSELSQGVYILKIQTENRVDMVKIVKH